MLQGILDRIKQQSASQELKSFSEKAEVSLIKGIKGSYLAFLLAQFNESEQRPFLVITEDKEEAAYLLNDLQGIAGHNQIHFLPDSFKRPINFEVVDPNNVLSRTEIVNQLTSSETKNPIIVTYPEALFEKVVDPTEVISSRLEVRVGAILDQETMMDVLLEYEFKRVDFVYEPGQFSIRGGIVDVFSLGNPWPFRVELFDDEVESIRSFDPLTQLSKEAKEVIHIIPDFSALEEQTQKISMLEILPQNTIVVAHDFQFLLDQLLICFEKAEAFGHKVTVQADQDLRKIFRERAFLYPRETIEQLTNKTVWLLSDTCSELKPVHTVSFDVSSQPSFSKNFNLLIENLQDYKQQGYDIYLFAENARQFTRFEAIFKDLDAKVVFKGIEAAIHEGFIAKAEKIVCYSDHQIFQRFHAYRLRQGFSKEKALNLRMVKDLVPGDYVTHIDHGIGRFSGLQKIEINGNLQEAVRLVYKNNDLLYVSIHSLHKISKYVGKEGKIPTLHKIGSDSWQKLKNRTKRRIKDIAKELIALYAKRKSTKGFAAAPDGYLQNELEASFFFEDTPDQVKVTAEVKKDMESDQPMDRLICGDVGFGKTEIAIRAAFKAILSGKQVAILVPTTILALQHHKTFSERLKPFGTEVDYVNRFKTAKQKREIFERLEKGELDLVIGTHAILSKKVKFKDLGLLVIDEEQKFGVAAKEKLRSLKVNVDTLTMTATPIPRTLQFSLMAARDLSVINTAPPNRQPIHTEVRTFNHELIQDAILYEVNRGGQVFFVHNRVKTLPDITAMVRKMCPEVKVSMAHGQMESKQLEEELMKFVRGEVDVLVSTNIIETGLDIPNANTMIINNANNFGLSDLHQLRGRIGRSNTKAYCYLIAPPMSTLTQDARKRLRTIEEYSDLGSGMNIAMRDMDIRGAGNILGGEQSGFIADIGYDTYQKILDEAIEELKQTDFKDLFDKDNKPKDGTNYVRDVQLETDQELLIPTKYIVSTQERLHLYSRFNDLKDEAGIEAFAKELQDRFGRLPKQVHELFNGLRIKWLARPLGFERVILKNQKLRCYFVMDPQSPFYDTVVFGKVLALLSSGNNPHKLNIKKSRDYLILAVDHVDKLKKALVVLEWLSGEVMG